LAAAQTGTGKTASFALPLLQRLSQTPKQPTPKSVRALVLTPTRELAAQVQSAIQTYGQHLKIRTALVFGGVGIKPQIDALRRGIDVLVATPGRLLDHVQQNTVDLSKVEMFVLDEADRMLDMGFIHDIKRVLKLLPTKKQSLLFSATFSEDIRALASGLIHNPVVVEVARRNTTAEIVTQGAYLVSKTRKRELLRDLIVDGNWQQVLVFTRMKHGANRLADQLTKDGLSAAAIHGNKSQNARTRALADFKENRVRVLVATDIAARGLDIEALPHVVNYELPNVPEDYVHRIGRTGRAGMAGHAISLVSEDEQNYLRDIERLIKKTIERLALPDSFATRAPNAAEIMSEEPLAKPRAQRAARTIKPQSIGQRTHRHRSDPHKPGQHASQSRPQRADSSKTPGHRPVKTIGHNLSRDTVAGVVDTHPKHSTTRQHRSAQASAPYNDPAQHSQHRRTKPQQASTDHTSRRSHLPEHLQGAFRRSR